MTTHFTPQGEMIVTRYDGGPTGKKQRVRAQGNLSYDGFLEVLVQLGKQALPGVLITEKDPDPNTNTPVITVEIVHETPWHGEIKARIRDIFPDLHCEHQDEAFLVCNQVKCSNYPYWEETCAQCVYPPDASMFRPVGESVVVWGQRFDTQVQFNCWGDTGPEASALATRFKRFMFTYTGVFKLQGVAEILYQERLRDRTVTQWRNDITSRSLRYLMTFEELYIQEYAVIRDIAVGLSERMRQVVENSVLFNCRTSIL